MDGLKIIEKLSRIRKGGAWVFKIICMSLSRSDEMERQMRWNMHISNQVCDMVIVFIIPMHAFMIPTVLQMSGYTAVQAPG